MCLLGDTMKKSKDCRYVTMSIFLIVLFFSISILGLPVSYLEGPNYWPTDSWQTSSLKKQGMNPELISDLKDYVENHNIGLTSMLIVRNGYLVDETYYGSDRINIINPIYSCTKSITSTLIGIAIYEGYLEGIQQKILDFFPNRTFENMDEDKQNITIWHLLTMTSGLEWDEYISYFSPANDLTAVKTESDWIQYILDKPMVSSPGTEFNYNTGCSHLLSAIIQKATGISMEAFALNHLFNYLNITNYTWNTDSQGITRGGEALSLTARDMAKIGFLYLHNGTWEDQQVVPKEWIQEATNRLVTSSSLNYAYGYQWWICRTCSIKHFSAWGWAGQRIFVVPSKNLVVIFTSFDTLSDVRRFLLEQYIIPAASDDYGSSNTWMYYVIPISSVIVITGSATAFLMYRRRKKS